LDWLIAGGVRGPGDLQPDQRIAHRGFASTSTALPHWTLSELLVPVLCNVVFRGMFCMFRRMHMMTVSCVSVMAGLLVIAIIVVPGCFLVVARSVLMVFRCLGVMMGCFF
jgi:hypothetical protein